MRSCSRASASCAWRKSWAVSSTSDHATSPVGSTAACASNLRPATLPETTDTSRSSAAGATWTRRSCARQSQSTESSIRLPGSAPGISDSADPLSARTIPSRSMTSVGHGTAAHKASRSISTPMWAPSCMQLTCRRENANSADATPTVRGRDWERASLRHRRRPVAAQRATRSVRQSPARPAGHWGWFEMPRLTHVGTARLR